MKSIEKYVFWASIVVLSALSMATIFYFVSLYPKIQFPSAILRIFALQTANIVFAFWLSWAAKKESRPTIPWALFGLSFGVIGVGVFYLIHIYFQNRVIKNALLAQRKET